MYECTNLYYVTFTPVETIQFRIDIEFYWLQHTVAIPSTFLLYRVNYTEYNEQKTKLHVSYQNHF